MFVLRWMRFATKGLLGFVTIVPVAALVVAVFLDRGPSGEVRISFFPMALLALDPFVWTCARNSVIFAVVLATSSLLAGVGLGWLLSRLQFWGQPVFRALSTLSLAASPMVMALGLVGIWGMPQPWPWPISDRSAVDEGASLETWRGTPLWLFWIWSTLPAAVAIVMVSIAPALERIDPAWEDAWRLAGAGRFRTWRRLIWPLIRPAGARAAAVVFSLALVEPGAALILGLRRTLAFQIVEAARRPDPFPRVAAWAAMAWLIALAGRMVLRRWGGPEILGRPEIAPTVAGDRPSARRAGRPILVAGLLTLIGASALGWLPTLGLFRAIMLQGPGTPTSGDGTSRPFAELVRQALEPPMPQIAAGSLLLGLEVATAIVVLAWMVQPVLGRARGSRAGGLNLVRPLAMMPALLQGVGILALPWLAGLLATPLRPIHRFEVLSDRLADLARELSPERNPWILLVAAVGLTVGLRFLRTWQRAAESESAGLRSGLDAALLAGFAPGRARGVAAWRPARWIGRYILVTCFSATCLAPALFFTPWMNGRTIAPGIVSLADGPDHARFQAAVLALLALSANIAALIVARLTSAWPREGEIEDL